MNNLYKLITVTLAAFLAISMSTSLSLAYKGGSGIPSCHDDIASRGTEPGTGPVCVPPILDKEKSLEVLNQFTVKKVAKKWYLFVSPDDLKGNLDAASKWQMISLLVSAVQSLSGEDAQCFIAQIPATEKDKEALLTGSYPQELIVAEAQAVPLSDEDKESKKWPEYHHHVLYKITVY